MVWWRCGKLTKRRSQTPSSIPRKIFGVTSNWTWYPLILVMRGINKCHNSGEDRYCILQSPWPPFLGYSAWFSWSIHHKFRIDRLSAWFRNGFILKHGPGYQVLDSTISHNHPLSMEQHKHLGGLLAVFDRCNGKLFAPNCNFMAHNEEKNIPNSPWSYSRNSQHDNTVSFGSYGGGFLGSYKPWDGRNTVVVGKAICL